jgi:ABC-2 type transport system ATP-binding protein
MINKGRCVLYGGLSEIKDSYRNNSVFVDFSGPLDGLEGVASSKNHGGYTELFLEDETSAQQVLQQLVSRKGDLHRFEVSTPSLNEIFLQVVGKKR